MKSLPSFLSQMLEAPPRAGEGVHHWLFRAARNLHAHLPAVEIMAMLEDRVQSCGRHVSRKEIEDAVRNSLACAWQPDKGRAATADTPTPRWPKVNHEQREAVIRDHGGLADLWELSNPRIEDGQAHTEQIIDWLFPGNPLLCCGKSNSDFDTRPREEWRGHLEELQHIGPSPMSRVEGVTKDGRPSRHALGNTGPRRFLIAEFDSGTLDEHAALLLHLGSYAPLVCAVHSGGKSLHGWFYVLGQLEEKVEKFFRYAVSLGADKALWTRSQFVRMPDGQRNNGRRQTVYYINLNPLKATR